MENMILILYPWGDVKTNQNSSAKLVIGSVVGGGGKWKGIASGLFAVWT